MESTRSMRSGSKFQAARFCTYVLLLPITLFCLSVGAQAQTQLFSLTLNPFTTNAVNPGGTDTASIVLAPLNGFSGAVSLSCQITPAPPNGNQGCQVSPQTVTPPTGASVTVSTAYTGGTWALDSYTITITGTGGGDTETSSQSFAVLPVTPAFYISVPAAIVPASVPAGNSSQGTIDINPINGYAGQVTLSCATVTPLVVSPPVCSFSPSVVNVGGTLATTTITITTTGPLQLTAAPQGRSLYAAWLILPMVTLAGVGAAAGGRRFAKLCGVIGLVLLSGCLLLLPACSTTTTSTAPQTGNATVTPNNTYTFRITGVDANGQAATNSGTGSTSTVTLTVTTATKK